MKSGEMRNGGWAIILSATAVMLATLPGRTQGLSLITEPFTAELNLSHTTFASINLWASLLGALLCLPAGWVFDRFGLRAPTAIIIGALAVVVAMVSRAWSSVPLIFGLLTMTRALGQSALSVASITAMGKRFGNRGGMPMAIFAIFVSLAFAIAFGLIGWAIGVSGWRGAWLAVAAGLIVLLPMTYFLRVDPVAEKRTDVETSGFELGEALKTPAFWTFAGAAALFNLVSSGFGLFNESILVEAGFSSKIFHLFLVVSSLFSLVGQFAAGSLSRKMSYPALTTLAMGLYALGLASLPFVRDLSQLLFVALLVGVAAGMIIVVFFAIWAEAFGQRHIGRIQGAAQCLTVISSAIGPVLFAKCHAATHSYRPILFAVAALVACVGVAAWRTQLPSAKSL